MLPGKPGVRAQPVDCALCLAQLAMCRCETMAETLREADPIGCRIPVYFFRSKVGVKPKALPLDAHAAAHVAELFRAFSDGSRVQIVSALMEGERNVSALAELVGVSESAISHHLRGLRQMRLVEARRSGRQVFYRMTDSHIVALVRQGVAHVLED
jgi:DNA-binding transcriptional ArsR family regulator